MDEMNNQKPPRRKGITSVTLQWVADKLRRAQRIKEELSTGSYQIDSAKVAQAIVNNSHNDGEESHH